MSTPFRPYHPGDRVRERSGQVVGTVKEVRTGHVRIEFTAVAKSTGYPYKTTSTRHEYELEHVEEERQP